MAPPLVVVVVLLAAAIAGSAAAAAAGGIGFEFHHRFSPAVRRWAEAHSYPGGWWPDAGKEASPEFYSALVRHDRALLARRHGRSLFSGDELLAFADGNETIRISSLGFLHYAIVALGTPNATFLVALDTGSDLFWVPCDCNQCAPNTSSRYEGLNFSAYSPSSSSTSKKVTCSDSLCGLPNACTGPNSSCPYRVKYLSENTSSSGVLVEVILYLRKEDASAEIVKAPIVFGCGQVQTGAFLDGGAPNGLLGLGMRNSSVPSILASKGLTADTFSMCFSADGVGRINFGDRGSSNQSETPFDVNDLHPTYNISITAIHVEEKSIPLDFAVIVDSGTSFTHLTDPAYSQLTSNFSVQVRERRLKVDPSSLPFEYCYSLSPNQTKIDLPAVRLTTKSGSLFPVTSPIVVLADQRGLVGYCLAVLKSDFNLSIIGQNFMTGLKIVFDRERLVLGWEEFDCYQTGSTNNLPVKNSTNAPAPKTFKPVNTETFGKPPASAPVPQQSSSGHLNASGSISFLLLLLFVNVL